MIKVEIEDQEAEDSISFLNFLKGNASGDRRSLVMQSNNGLFALRQGHWKYIEGLGSGGFTAPSHVGPVPDGPEGQLYNLHKDSGEQTYLYLEYPDIVRQMATLLHQIREEHHTRSNQHVDDRTNTNGES